MMIDLTESLLDDQDALHRDQTATPTTKVNTSVVAGVLRRSTSWLTLPANAMSRL